MTKWESVADELRQAICAGRIPPGGLLPRESELMAAYEVGRETIRRAVAQLAAEGLVEPRRRRGTMVRARTARDCITQSRTVRRDGLGYHFGTPAQPWRALEPPAVSRGPVPYDIAVLLDMEADAEAVIRDRLIGNPETREPAQLSTSYIPASLAAEVPVLAALDTAPMAVYDHMEEAGLGPLEWTEAITARMPAPDEARRLHLASRIPLLRIVRVARTPSGRPLEVSDTRFNAERFEVGYPIIRHESADHGTAG